MSDVRTSKPTCSSCPFFLRPRGGPVAVDATGQCLYGRSIPVPMGTNAGGGLVIGTMRPPTTHDMTCADHPMMGQWLQKTYGTARATDWEATIRNRWLVNDPKGGPELHAREAPDPREREEAASEEREREVVEREMLDAEDEDTREMLRQDEADRRRDAHQITKLRLTDG